MLFFSPWNDFWKWLLVLIQVLKGVLGFNLIEQAVINICHIRIDSESVNKDKWFSRAFEQ